MQAFCQLGSRCIVEVRFLVQITRIERGASDVVRGNRASFYEKRLVVLTSAVSSSR